MLGPLGASASPGLSAMNVVSFPPPPEGAAPPILPPQPLIKLPPMTAAILAILVIVQIFVVLLPSDAQRLALFYNFGLVPAYYTETESAGWRLFTGPFTYMLLHGGWMHLVMNSAMLMAFGAGIERWIGPARMLALFVLCGLAAAVIQFAASPFSTVPIVGASGAISGLFAAVMVMLRETVGLNAGRRGLWPFLTLWIGITILTGIIGGPDGARIAWQAHIGGFLSGFLFLRLLRHSGGRFL